jgi:uncharacterized protein YozE (UPF0346 family)
MSKRRSLKADIEGDVIKNIRFTPVGDKGTEIPVLPGRHDLNVLRYDNGDYVNLTDLNQIWVDPKGGLHCKDIGNCDLVNMTYADRKRLIKDGSWRLKTDLEFADENNQKEYSKIAGKRRLGYPKISDQLDEILRYLSTKNDLTAGLQAVIEKWQETKNKHPKG